MKKLFIFLLLGLFLVSFASATDNIFTLVKTGDSTESASPRAGLSFTVLHNGYMVNATKHSSSTADRAYLYVASDADSGNLLATGTFSGDVATINYPINSSSTYFILAGLDSGGSYTRTFTTSISYPQTNAQVSVNGFVILDSGGLQTNNYRNMVSFYTNNSTASPTVINISQVSPLNASAHSTSTMNLTTYFNMSGTNQSYQWVNSTQYVWFSNGSLFTTNFTTLSGNNTQSLGSITGLVYGNYLWNSYAYYQNATFKNITFAPSNFTFEWRPFNVTSQNYTPFIYETDYQYFNLTIDTLDSILSVVSELSYNGTNYDATTSCSDGTCNITAYIDIPLVTTQTETQNKSFYWTITVYDGTSTYSFNTTSETKYQSVTRTHLEECNATYTVKALNFTAAREDNLTVVNPFYIAGTFSAWLGSGTVFRNSSFEKTSTSNLSLCIKPVNETLQIEAEIEYSFDNVNITYIPRNYFFDNASINNETQNITLYLLDSEDSTSFIQKVQDQKLAPIEGALIYTQRYYPSDGQYRTVQISKTDSSGKTVGFYEVEIPDYKHIIVLDRETLLDTERQKVVGEEVPFTLTFTTGDALAYAWSYFQFNEDIATTLSFNKTTNIVTYSYIDSTGATALGRLLVYLMSENNNTIQTICNSSSSQASATITCNMSSYDGTFTAYGYIDGEPSDVLPFAISLARDIMSNEGLFMGMMIIMVAGFAFIWNPVAGVIGIEAALIFVNVIGFISVSPIFIYGSVALAIMAVILFKS